MNILDSATLHFFSFFEAHTLGVVFLSSLFGGEPVVLFLSSLSSAQGMVSIWLVGVIGYSTAIIGEMFWFLLARSPLAMIVTSKVCDSLVYKKYMYLMSKVERGKPLRLLFLTRVISGFTIVLIIYFSQTKMSLRTFLKYIMIINIFWTPLIVVAGWSIGKGFSLLLDIIEDVQWVMTITAAMSILGYFLYKKITWYVLKRTGQVELQEDAL